MLATWLPLATLALWAPTHETAVQRHHRKGVHCMDVIERNDCAIEQFELVLDEDTRERELVTDAMVRLIRLYRKAGDDDGLTGVLRRYWDVGTARQSRGHLPYGMRFFSAELDVMFVGDIERAREAPFLQRTSPQAAEFIFTCDDQRRADILMTQRWRRAEQVAQRRGVSTQQAYYEAWDERRAKRAKRDRSRAERKPEREAEKEASKAPIFSELPCELAERLGQDSLLGWTRIAGAASHQDYRRSMMIAEIPDVLPRLSTGVREGAFEVVGPDHWTIADTEFADQPVHVVRVDLDQLLVAREDMLAPVLEAVRKRKRRMNKELERLAQQIPRDSAMVFAMTQAAVVGSGFGDMRQGASTFLQAILPKPKGLQVSVAMADVAGIFTRVPTNNPVKGRMLVNLATTVLEGQAQDDPEAARMLENLDIAEAGDRRALLAAYLLDAQRMAEMMWDD
ncbi:MAG: hypothetical protein ACE37F_05485 [Nannocystaceae bacterium]|nr:hypothetical protein [bacterium]